MNILFLEWHSFGNPFIKTAFENLGHTIHSFPFPQSSVNTRNDETLASNIAKSILSLDIDFVFSFNYFPVAAIAAAACKVKYLSWTYDSPFVQLYSKTAAFKTNELFVFDSLDVSRLSSFGVPNVHYLPMAAANYDSILPSKTEEKAYSSEITMVGSMYTEEKHGFMKRLENLDDYTKGYLDAVVAAQSGIFGASILEESITPAILEKLQEVCPIHGNGDGFESPEWTLANYFLARSVTAKERQDYIKALSRKHQVTLFTPSPTPDLPDVKNMGTLEYYHDAPKAIKCAKINLNISLRSIVHGIPLRCMDIFGCGGFLLTNYQADFEKHFIAGEDYAYYDSLTDLLDKADYYLKNDKERKEMAANALKKVRQEHTFEKRVLEMLSIAGF